MMAISAWRIDNLLMEAICFVTPFEFSHEVTTAMITAMIGLRIVAHWMISNFSITAYFIFLFR